MSRVELIARLEGDVKQAEKVMAIMSQSKGPFKK